MDFMADLPEGATPIPIQSMRVALEALRAMDRPERPALPSSDGAVDVDAETVATSGKHSRYTGNGVPRSGGPLLHTRMREVG